MASQVEIANRALTKLGAARIISFGDDNKQARAISSMFDHVYRSELRTRVWSFTKKRTSLPALATTPAWGFTYEYQLPSDFIRLLQVDEIYTGVFLDDYVNSDTSEYAIEGGKILTDFAAPLKIKYCADISDTTQWDVTFVEAIASRLAYELAEDLTQSNQKKADAMSDYQRAMSAAIKSNAIEIPPQQVADNTWIMSRI